MVTQVFYGPWSKGALFHGLKLMPCMICVLCKVLEFVNFLTVIGCLYYSTSLERCWFSKGYRAVCCCFHSFLGRSFNPLTFKLLVCLDVLQCFGGERDWLCFHSFILQSPTSCPFKLHSTFVCMYYGTLFEERRQDLREISFRERLLSKREWYC